MDPDLVDVVVSPKDAGAAAAILARAFHADPPFEHFIPDPEIHSVGLRDGQQDASVTRKIQFATESRLRSASRGMLMRKTT